jgi:hypothetical protein
VVGSWALVAHALLIGGALLVLAFRLRRHQP